MLARIIKKIKLVPSYLYRNYAAPRLYSIRDRKILSQNLGLKNKYAGRRCFIIGAGPSINSVDLTKLNREYTFVMNEFEKNAQYYLLAPKFHLISDSIYYDEKAASLFLQRFREKDKQIPRETTMLLNLASRPFIEKYGLFKNHNVFYIGTQGIMSDKLPFSIKLDHYVPWPKNSLLLCLISAYFMGFSEIYVLGCEHNFLSQPPRPGQTSLANWYPYGYTDEDFANLDPSNLKEASKFTSAKDLFLNYETAVANVLQLFKNYRLFYKKVREIRPDIRIFNATPNSFLDVFPVINFEEIKGVRSSPNPLS